jgi:hypothetical protein
MKCAKCKRKIYSMPFKCHHCGSYFCDKHRLPEDHKCEELRRRKAQNQERWKNTVSNYTKSYSQPAYSTSTRKHHKHKHRKHRHSERKEKSISLKKYSNTLSYLWRRNRKTIKKIIKWAIILLVLYFLFQYYQDNDEKIKGMLNESANGFKMMGKDFMATYNPPHEIPIDKSYFVGGYAGVDKIEVTLHQEVYDYFLREPHEYTYSSYSSYSSPPEGWERDYWTMFISNEEDEYIIKEIVDQVKNKTGSDGDQSVKAIARFVQKIPYDWERAEQVTLQMQYPYETLYMEKGVCADKAMLMAKLLDELGYGIALFEYHVGNHMAVGIECPYEKSNYKSGFCFIEPSDVYPIGQIPQEYVGGVDIRYETPSIYSISKGKSYSK